MIHRPLHPEPYTKNSSKNRKTPEGFLGYPPPPIDRFELIDPHEGVGKEIDDKEGEKNNWFESHTWEYNISLKMRTLDYWDEVISVILRETKNPYFQNVQYFPLGTLWNKEYKVSIPVLLFYLSFLSKLLFHFSGSNPSSRAVEILGKSSWSRSSGTRWS